MNTIALFTGSFVIYWSGIVIALGAVAGLALALALYSSHNRYTSGLWLMTALTIIISIPLCRFLHWCCHVEQYRGFISAMTDYSSGGFCLPGAFAGCAIAAIIVKKALHTPDIWKLLDAFAPGLAIAIAFIRLSCMFNSTYRGKFYLTSSVRFPVYIPAFAIMLALAAGAVAFYILCHNDEMKSPCSAGGNVARLLLAAFSAVEIVLDSMRYDSSFLHFSGPLLKYLNKLAGSVSVAQLAAAVCIIWVFVFYIRCSIAANGKNILTYIMCGAFAAGFIGAAACEYLVQRYTGSYAAIYVFQTASAAVMMAAVCLAYVACREKIPQKQ